MNENDDGCAVEKLGDGSVRKKKGLKCASKYDTNNGQFIREWNQGEQYRKLEEKLEKKV